jgi:site-specific recombinase XerD
VCDMNGVDWNDNQAQDLRPLQKALHKYMPTPRALSVQAVQQLKQTMLDWVNRIDGEASQLLWPHRDRAIVLLMLYAGVTIDELCALNMDDLMEDAQEQRESRRCLRVGTMRRVIPLGLEARQVLSRWLAMRGLVFGNRPCPALFVTRGMKRINRTMVRGLIARLQRESGVTFDTFALRHTFVRDLVRQGLPPDDISGMLGRPSHDVIALYARG